MSDLLSQLPTEYLWLAFGAKLAAELYSSVRAGGGLKRILCSFWFGEQLPKPIAEDYKQELSTDDK
jgi:hypothetical protein